MQNGCTALIWAASQGHVNVVQRLVEAGANLEAVSMVSGSMFMCDMVIDAVWIHSNDMGCQPRSCKCSATLGRGGSKPRGSKHGEWEYVYV